MDDPSSIAEWSDLFYSWVEKDGRMTAHSNIRLKTVLMIKRLPKEKEEASFDPKPLRQRLEERRKAKASLEKRNKEAEDYRKNSEFLEIRALITSSAAICWSKTIFFAPIEEKQVFQSSSPSGEIEIEIDIEVEEEEKQVFQSVGWIGDDLPRETPTVEVAVPVVPKRSTKDYDKPFFAAKHYPPPTPQSRQTIVPPEPSSYQLIRASRRRQPLGAPDQQPAAIAAIKTKTIPLEVPDKETVELSRTDNRSESFELDFETIQKLKQENRKQKRSSAPPLTDLHSSYFSTDTFKAIKKEGE